MTLKPVRQFLRPPVNKLMIGWVVLALVGTAAFLVLVLPYRPMPDVSNTPWHELARGVAPGDEGAHEPDDPYFIVGTNESEPSAAAAMKRRLVSQGWRVDRDPAPGGGATFVRADYPKTGKVLWFGSFLPGLVGEDLEDVSDAQNRLGQWHRQYSNIYILEMIST